MADQARIDALLLLEDHDQLPPDHVEAVRRLRAAGQFPDPLYRVKKRPDARAPMEAPTPFDPEGSAPGSTRQIADERELEGTGLPPGTSMIEAGRNSPDFQRILEQGGKSERVVARGNRYYTTGRATTKQDDNMGGEFDANDAEAEMRDQLPVERTQLGEAPGAARESAGFALDELEGYKRALGPGAQVRRVQSQGPLKDRIVYRMSDDAPWTTVAKPGMGITTGDVRSLAGEVAPTLGGMAGGVLGSFAGSPVLGGVLGTGMGAAAGEFSRITEGLRRGVIPADTPPLDIVLAVAKRAGLDAAGAGAGVALFKAYKLFQRRGLPDIGMTEEQFLAALRAKGVGLDQRGRNLLTPGDVVGETAAGARIKAAEERLRRDANPAADPFRQRQIDKNDYGRERLEAELPLRDPGVTPTNLGEGVAAAAPDANLGLKGLGGEVHPDNAAAGDVISTAMRSAEDKAEAAARQIYSGVDAAMAGKTIKPVHTEIAVGEYRSILESDVFKKLTEEDATLIKNWAAEAFDDAGNLKELSYGTIDRGIKSMRRAIRAANKGEWSGDQEMLHALEEQLVADRLRMIKAQPNGAKIAADLEAAEGAWKDIKATFRRTKANDFLRTIGGRQALGDDAVGGRLFSDPGTARVVGKILQDPDYANAREAARAMLRWEINRSARGKGGDISEDALRAMLKDNEEVLGSFFTKHELSNFSHPAKLQEMRRAMGVAKMENPSEWFEKFWANGNTRDAAATMARLHAVSPDMAKAVRGFAQQKIYTDLTSDSAMGGGKVFDPDKFSKLLDQDNGQRAEWLAHVLDPGFGARLRSVSEAVRTLNPGHPKIADAAPQEPGAFGMAKRFGRLALGPLSATGRRYNLAVSLMSDKVKQRSMEAILDPQVYASLLKRGKVTRKGRATAAIIGQGLMEGATSE